MLDLLAAREEIDLTAIYAGGSVQRREWELESSHRSVVLEGRRVPGAHRVLRHDYPVTPGVFGALRDAQPGVVVVSGWSTFASQAAIAWCRLRRVPYVLLVESNDRDERPGWRRAVKGTVVPAVVRGAAHVLVVGTLARESMLARGADPGRIDVFADTIDVAAFGERADALAPRRDELRGGGGSRAGRRRGPLRRPALAGEGARHARPGGRGRGRSVGSSSCSRAAGRSGSGWRRSPATRASGSCCSRTRPGIGSPSCYAVADVFALLSTHEPWGVVVNEAAACGLPLVLSDRVGAAHDLLEDGRNGVLVPAGDAAAAGDALARARRGRGRRRAMGAASRQLVRGWGYEPSIETLLGSCGRVVGRG